MSSRGRDETARDTALVGKRLREARLASPLRTQVNVAAELQRQRGSTGVPQSYVAKIETGRRRVTAEELQWFAAVYGRPVAWFLGDDTAISPVPAPANAFPASTITPCAVPAPPVRRARGRSPGAPHRPTSRPGPAWREWWSPKDGVDYEARAARRAWLSALIVESSPGNHGSGISLDRWTVDDLDWLPHWFNTSGETPLYEALRCHAWSAASELIEWTEADVFARQAFAIAPRAIRRRGARVVPATPWALAVWIVRHHPDRAAQVGGPDGDDPLTLLDMMLSSDTASGCDLRLSDVRAAIQAQRDYRRRLKGAHCVGANFQVAARLDDDPERTRDEIAFYRQLRSCSR